MIYIVSYNFLTKYSNDSVTTTASYGSPSGHLFKYAVVKLWALENYDDIPNLVILHSYVKLSEGIINDGLSIRLSLILTNN